MDRQSMMAILHELRSELAENRNLDTHQRKVMEALAEEVERRVDSPETKLSGDEFLVSKLKSETENFKINHPKLTEILGRMSDLLARMGI